MIVTRMLSSRRRQVVFAVALAAGVAAGAGIAVASSGPALPASTAALSPAAAATTPVSTAGFPSGGKNAGIFTDRCGHSHEAADDPIMAPGKPGASMHHDFYGNTTTSANSTAAALVGGTTTCTTTADASGYWTPVLYQHGVALTPGPALIYWRRPAKDAAAVQTVPAGLQMIAGNEGAAAPQATSVTAWTCTGAIGSPKTATPHDCASGADLRLIVTFPSCWDGHTLTGNMQTNVVYRTSAG